MVISKKPSHDIFPTTASFPCWIQYKTIMDCQAAIFLNPDCLWSTFHASAMSQLWPGKTWRQQHARPIPGVSHCSTTNTTLPAGTADEALSGQRQRSAACAVALLAACVVFEEGARLQDPAAVPAAADKPAAGGLLGASSKKAAVQLPAAQDMQPLRIG